MIRFCPKCGDFYADASLAFCLADGTPLVGVDPHTESWSKGARVVEAKEQARRRQQRRLKVRRVLMSMTTMLIVIMVVTVVAFNSYIYLKPKPEEAVLLKPSTPDGSSNPTMPVKPDEPVPSPSLSTSPSPLPSPSLSPSPSPSPSPSSSPSLSPSPSPSTRLEAIPEASPSPTVTVTVTLTPTLTTPPTPTPTPTPTSTRKPGLTITLLPPPSCSEDDKRRERDNLIRQAGGRLRQAIERDRSRIVNENKPPRAEFVEADFGQLQYEVALSETCAEASVTVRYAWKISYQEKNAAAEMIKKNVTVAQTKEFRCVKAGEAWRCR